VPPRPTAVQPGLILRGVVALGVLTDPTVTRAAAVWELRAADPTGRAGQHGSALSGACRLVTAVQ
jgi:hypothetical protein